MAAENVVLPSLVFDPWSLKSCWQNSHDSYWIHLNASALLSLVTLKMTLTFVCFSLISFLMYAEHRAVVEQAFPICTPPQLYLFSQLCQAVPAPSVLCPHRNLIHLFPSLSLSFCLSLWSCMAIHTQLILY